MRRMAARSAGMRKTRVALLAVLVATLGPHAAFGESDAQRAPGKGREHFEFPRKTVAESDFHVWDPVHAWGALPATGDLPALVFAHATDVRLEGPGGCNSHPIVLISSEGRWWAVSTELSSWYWDSVWVTPDRSRIWGVLEFHCGDPGDGAILLSSVDGGWSWRTLSKVTYGSYQDGFHTMRMGPDGQGSLMVSKYCEWTAFPCPEGNDSVSEEDHSMCGGWDVFRTSDFGATWSEPTFSHGRGTPLLPRREEMVKPVFESRHFDIVELRKWFDAAPKELDPNLPPGASSLALDEALLRRARSVTWTWHPFLEATNTSLGKTSYPFILETRGLDQDWEDVNRFARLIKLPYPNFGWQAIGFGLAGILQPSNREAGETWVLNSINKQRQWFAGTLSPLPGDSFHFENLYMTRDGQGELHLRRTLQREKAGEPGRYVYHSADYGRSWTGPTFEVDILIPVEPTPYHGVIESDDIDIRLDDGKIVLPEIIEKAVRHVPNIGISGGGTAERGNQTRQRE